MQIGRVEAGATAPTTAWPPSVAETSEDSWEEYGAINAMSSQQCWTCKGHGHVSQDYPNGKGKGKGKDNFGKGKGAYEWGKCNYDGNKGSNYGMYKGGGKANSPSSYGPVKGYQKGDGKTAGKGPRHGKCHTCGEDHFARDRSKSLGDMGRAATGRTRTCSVIATRSVRRFTASGKKFMTCTDMNCNCKDGQQQIGGEVSAPPGLQVDGQDGA